MLLTIEILLTPKKEKKTKDNHSRLQIGAPQDYNQLKMRFLENVDLQNSYPNPQARRDRKHNN